MTRDEFYALPIKTRHLLAQSGRYLEYAVEDPMPEVRAAVVPFKVYNERLQKDPSGAVQYALLLEGDYKGYP